MINFDNILRDFKEAYKQHIEDSGHNASGNLANSMTWDVEEGVNRYIITLTLPEYAKYVEEGIKPHFPPIDAIKQWIRIKPVMPRPLANGKLPTENQLAYLISRKISLEGTKPTHLLENTMNDFQLIGKIYNKISEELQKTIISEKYSIKFE